MYRSVIAADQITILSRKQFGELACEAGYADKFLDINHFSFLFNPSSPDSRTDTFFNQFDHCLILSGDDSPLLKAAQQYKHLTILYQAPFPTQQMPIIDYHLSLFDLTALQCGSICPSLTRLFSSSSNQETKHTRIAIAPGSGSRRKNWPLERFQIVADHLENQGYHVSWIAGECEAEFRFRDKDHVVKNTDLISLCKLLHECALYIGNDSGITHLAAASGSPVIALFGASNPKIWAPRGISEVRCIISTKCTEYCQTNNRNVDCNGECMGAILVDDVILTTQSVLNSF
jgi:hypothetical protein